MLLAGIYSLLIADSGMQAALNIGSRADGTTGCFGGLAPKEATLPYVTFRQVSAKPVTSFAGVNRLGFARLRFSCNAGSYLVAKAIAQAVKNVLNGLLATLNEGTQVQGGEIVMEFDSVEEATQGTIFTTHCDFSISFIDND